MSCRLSKRRFRPSFVEGAVRLQPPSDEELVRLRELVAGLEEDARKRKRRKK
jgi:hypothetical protein